MLVHAPVTSRHQTTPVRKYCLTDLTTCHNASALVLIELFIEGGDLGREQALHHARLWKHQRDLRSPASVSWSCKGEHSPHPGSDTNDGSSECWAQEHTGNQGMGRAAPAYQPARRHCRTSQSTLYCRESSKVCKQIADRMRNRTSSMVLFLADDWPAELVDNPVLWSTFITSSPSQTRGGGSHIKPIH